MRRLVIRGKFHHTSLSLDEDGEIIESFREDPTQISLMGGIYKGRVSKVKKEMGLVWLDLDGSDLKGFLNVSTIEKSAESMKISTYRSNRGETFFEEGDVVMCQITKDGVGDKKPTVSTNIMINGSLLILMPFCHEIRIARKFTKEQKDYISEKMDKLSNKKYGYIIRTSFLEGSDEDIIKEMEKLETEWKIVENAYECAKSSSYIYRVDSLLCGVIKDYERDSRITEVIVSEPQIYELLKNRENEEFSRKVQFKDNMDPFFKNYSFMKIIGNLTDRKVPLASGANIVIDKTEALTVIDVNTANCTANHPKDPHMREEIIFDTNKLAAREIAKQIRLRNIGGIIIVDFIDMKSETNKNKLLELLAEYTADDRMKVSIKGMSSLGLVEMTRQRRFETLTSRLMNKCCACGGSGYTLTPQVILNMVHDRIVWEILPKNPKIIHLYLEKNMRKTLVEYLKFDLELEKFITENNIIIHTLDNAESEQFKILYE